MDDDEGDGVDNNLEDDIHDNIIMVSSTIRIFTNIIIIIIKLLIMQNVLAEYLFI